MSPRPQGPGRRGGWSTLPPRVRSTAAVLVLVVLAALVLLVERGADPSTDDRAGTSSGRVTGPARPGAGATPHDPDSGLAVVALDQLPAQVADTLALVDRGGPYPNRQDGVVFGNRQRLLPARASGYYHEYTVVTPGSSDRGARRLVTGDQDRLLYYTGDHYLSFVRIRR